MLKAVCNELESKSIPNSETVCCSRVNLNKDIFGRGLNLNREILYTWIGILVTVVATALFSRELIEIFLKSVYTVNLKLFFEQIVFSAAVGLLIHGNLTYQLTRIGYLKRLKKHRPASPEELETIYDKESPSLVVLIPSYNEEIRIIRQSILSAALQEYPNRRVVLLIDNPPNPKESADKILLYKTRSLIQEIQQFLAEPATEFGMELKKFLKRKKLQKINLHYEISRLARLHLKAAEWFEKQAATHPVTNHEDQLFVDITFLDRSEVHKRCARELEQNLFSVENALSEERVFREYNRLADLFDVGINSFERKRYNNLSHASNKAMNLNSYIGLFGKSFNEVIRKGHLHLELTESVKEKISIPDAEYIITLDADSILSHDYALRLVHLMNQPGNENLAVVQTPYTAPPNAPRVLERVAGATTDMQYIVHQGFTRNYGTYWVGANALLRKCALDDISIVQEERGFKVTLFIQDRTVIEDTESSVDLIYNGWKLFNYPERLSYSATPPDFGALLIQRRRWANGGLIIFPKLIRYLFENPGRLFKSLEGFMRIQYLTSIAGVNIGLLLILIYPFEENLRILWLPLTAIPYFFFYGRDLVQAGYRTLDLLRVYALNLMLLPINLGGVFKSLHQGFTGTKIPFARTPKVKGWTTAPSLYILSEYFITFYLLTGFVVDMFSERWFHAAFALLNAIFFAYAIYNFMGLRNSKMNLKINWNASKWFYFLTFKEKSHQKGLS